MRGIYLEIRVKGRERGEIYLIIILYFKTTAELRVTITCCTSELLRKYVYINIYLANASQW